MYRVLIVEDEDAIAQAVAEELTQWGLETRCARDFRNVLGEFEAFQPHLVLLDIMLPFFNGYHWCNEIRKTSNVPIVFLSSASENMNMGGDDFVSKPFDRNVLVAKVQAILRRCYDFRPAAPVLRHRGAELNTLDSTLRFGGQKIELTRNEYKILLCLLENKGAVVSREKLMERLWESDSFVDENTLTVNVNRLRKKLDGAGLPGFVVTKFGVGYQLGD